MSSYYDDASLMLLASGGAQKDGKVYSVKPTDGSGDFTFTRGSNLSATRVNASQLIEKGRENLFLQSNQFDTTWAENYLSRTSGQSGYDGTNDAWKLQGFSGTAEKRIRQNTTATGIVTLSVYAKAGNIDFLWLRGVTSSTNVRTFFDLTNGTIGTNAAVSSKITSVGNGWYRCEATFNQQAGFEHYIGISDADGSAVSSTTGYLYIQDAQLEQGLVATPYIETGASTAQAGILENTPRFDYSGGATCPSLLLEPSRTNQCSQSEYIGSIDWNQGGITRSLVITQTSETNPEGASICWKIQGTASDNQLANNSSTNSGTTITNSVYVKRVSGTSNVLLRNVNNNDTSFSLSVADGWKRIDVTATATSATARFYLNLLDFNDEILVWGAQQEIGNYPTSYIPTYGVNQTRATESYANNSATNLIGQTEGVLFIDFVPNTDTLSTKWLTFLGGGSNYIGIYIPSSSNNIRLEVADTTNQATFNVPYVAGQRYKCAIAYANNDVTAYANGVQLGSDTNASIPATSTIRSYYNLSNIESTDTNQLLLFKTRLTNAELAALTTI